ncbi:MAG: hypothetical protein LBR36_01880, partial [Bacteroidales bacterium]|nr:hypothetical protein [Bacteroidales bacterium]
MHKYFNVAGPCREDEHYMIDATERLHYELENLIEKNQYFAVSASSNSGKTTFATTLVNKINNQGDLEAVYYSFKDISTEEKAIEDLFDSIQNDNNVEKMVVIFDDINCLNDNALLLFLRIIRNGYIQRSFAPFPSSIILIGNQSNISLKFRIRSYLLRLDSTSPFDLIHQLELRNFTKEEVYLLYNQHTMATGQVFEKSAVELVFEQTQGQPWLVNAIAREVVEKQLKKDFSITITPQMIETAINTIILRRDVHIDQLLDKLKDERVKKIVEPMILGESGNIERMSDDFNYVLDLGLIKVEKNGIMPANPIYAEVIIRTLSYDSQEDLAESKPLYQMPRYFQNDRIDMELLLTDFQQFWRENSAVWEERYQYKEAAPHLILQA